MAIAQASHKKQTAHYPENQVVSRLSVYISACQCCCNVEAGTIPCIGSLCQTGHMALI